MTLPPIDLPWPAPELSPNSRVHWARKAPKVKHARMAAFALLSASVPARERKLDWPKVGVRVEFFPPDRRHRDRDNIQASCKAYFDGISDAIGIDDRHFVPTYSLGDPVKGGLVRVTLSPVVESST